MKVKHYLKDKRYLYEYDNRAIVAFFLIIAIVNVGVIIYKKNIDDFIIKILTVSGVTIASILLWFFKKNKPSIYVESKNGISNKSNMQFVGAINYDQLKGNNNIIKRDEHVKNIVLLINKKFNENGFKSIILTGDSGSGKSILINLLKHYLENDVKYKDYSVVIKRDYYNFNLTPNDKQVIFLDQFENVINYKKFITKIKEYSKKNNCVFVFSFPQNYLSHVKNLFFSKNINNALKDIYVLSLNNDDIENYKMKISNFCKIDQIYIDEYIKNNVEERKYIEEICDKVINENIKCKKLCDELIKVMQGNAPLIELELLGYILTFEYGENIHISENFSFIDIFLDDWVARFLNKETAYSILFLMSEFKYFSIDDIRLATFEEKKHFEYDYSNREDGLLLKSLKDNPFIYTSNNYDLCGAKHQYISEQFRRYCQDKEIPEGVRNYIPHLIRCIDNKNNEDSEYSYEKLDENYNRYYSNHYEIFIMLIFMFIGVLVINVIQINESIEVHCQLILNSLISLPSIYYIYNYCKRFFLISNNIMARLTYVAGATGIAASYYYINWWGILFGLEIIILAISIAVAYHNKKSRTVNRIFLKDFFVFGAIGAVIFGLGIIFVSLFSALDSYEQTSGSFIACMHSYYVLFFIYSLLSVINHIKYSYIIGRIGFSNIVK